MSGDRIFFTDYRASEASRCGCLSRLKEYRGEHLVPLVRGHFKDCLAVTEAGTQQHLRNQAGRYFDRLVAEPTPFFLMDELLSPTGRGYERA